MRIRIKICGITQFDDARIAASLGVDALGFIFVPKSPRYIEPAAAHEIIRQLPPFVNTVGVFADEPPESVRAIAQVAGIDTVQLHGNEPPEWCEQVGYPVIKAFSVKSIADLANIERYRANGCLLDTWDAAAKGGTGRTFDWTIAETAVRKYHHVILAGGLGPTNIKEALERVLPYGVDVNSGVEIRPGFKNPHKMREVIDIVKSWK